MPRATTKTLATMPEAKPTAKSYEWDWDQLLDGAVWELERGVDYSDAESLQAALTAECERRGVPSVKTQVTEDSVVLQAAIPEEIHVEPELAATVVEQPTEDWQTTSRLAREANEEEFRQDRDLQAIWLRVMGEEAPPRGKQPGKRHPVTQRLPDEWDLEEVDLPSLQAEIVRRHARAPMLVPMVEYVKKVVEVPVRVEVKVDEAGNRVEPAPKPARVATAPAAVGGRVGVIDLLRTGLLTKADKVVMVVGGKTQDASITDDGQLVVAGVPFESVSAAGMRASALLGKERVSINGWAAFTVVRGGVNLGTMASIREKYQVA